MTALVGLALVMAAAVLLNRLSGWMIGFLCGAAESAVSWSWEQLARPDEVALAPAPPRQPIPVTFGLAYGVGVCMAVVGVVLVVVGLT